MKLKIFKYTILFFFSFNCYLNPLLQDQFSGEESSDNSDLILGAAILAQSVPVTILYLQDSYSLTVGESTSIPVSTTGTITSCTISPSLPSGLSINNSTCEISGSPTTSSSSTSYTITATYSGGSVSASITITVNSTSTTTSVGLSNLTIVDNGGSPVSFSPDFSNSTYSYTTGSTQSGTYIFIPTPVNSSASLSCYNKTLRESCDSSNNTFNSVIEGSVEIQIFALETDGTISTYTIYF